VRTTGQIGLFRIVSESGVAAGVRRVEAVTGPLAYERALADRDSLRELAAALRTREENVTTRVHGLVEETRELHRQLERARSQGSADVVGELLSRAASVDGTAVIAAPVDVADVEEARVLGDRLRERMASGVAVLAAKTADRASLFAVVTDDLVKRGVRADRVVRDVAALVGGKGGGRPHFAQGGVGDPERIPDALASVPEIVKALLAGGGK
jgi:alanyl-tRNA synthetase